MAATEVKIPKGWRLVEPGEFLVRGDKYLLRGAWIPTRKSQAPSSNLLTYIRRLSPTPKQVKAKGTKGKGK